MDELANVVLGRKIIPGKTLVVFDEIQDCPRAIQSLKSELYTVPMEKYSVIDIVQRWQSKHH